MSVVGNCKGVTDIGRSTVEFACVDGAFSDCAVTVVGVVTAASNA